MTRFPMNYELLRRKIYVSKAWQAHSSFTPEEVAHVTMLNKRVAELTESSLEYAVAEALRKVCTLRRDSDSHIRDRTLTCLSHASTNLQCPL